MGQYFVFINIDKRQKLPSFGGMKMGEFFFSDYPAAIVELLAVPEGISAETRHGDALSWAGDRIICIGDYVGDWPDSILAADDCRSLESPRFLYNNAVRISSRNIANPPKYASFGVLRNLTKKIYVRADGIPALGKDNELRLFKKPPIDCVPGFGSVLLSRVGWSADPSVAMSWENADTLVEGEWAGDRFDVRSYDEVKEELEADGWIDASQQEAERTRSLWKSDGD